MATRKMSIVRTEKLSVPEGDEPITITYKDTFGEVFFAVVGVEKDERYIERIAKIVLESIVNVSGARIQSEDGREFEVGRNMDVKEFNQVSGGSFATWKDVFYDSFAPHLFRLSMDVMRRNNLLNISLEEKKEIEGN